jgi:hypothetical protein
MFVCRLIVLASRLHEQVLSNLLGDFERKHFRGGGGVIKLHVSYSRVAENIEREFCSQSHH